MPGLELNVGFQDLRNYELVVVNPLFRTQDVDDVDVGGEGGLLDLRFEKMKRP